MSKVVYAIIPYLSKTVTFYEDGTYALGNRIIGKWKLVKDSLYVANTGTGGDWSLVNILPEESELANKLILEREMRNMVESTHESKQKVTG